MSHLPLEIQSSAFFWRSGTLFRYWWQDILENIGIIPSIYFLFLALIHFFSSGEKVSFWIGTQVKNINFKTNFLLLRIPQRWQFTPSSKFVVSLKFPIQTCSLIKTRFSLYLHWFLHLDLEKCYCLATLEWKIKLLSFLNRHWVSNFTAAILIWLAIRPLIAVIKARVKK